ncbi:MAG: hypothetical protein HY725_02195 [Candidatus Rokubacteria bacterium]|nr:hypothetical protein [Candidatus Rokubacteria bacterium]
MTFDLDHWKERLRERLDGWWRRAERAGATSVYAGLTAAALWPLVEAAQKGEMIQVILALGAVSGGVGANLIAEQIQRWKDRTDRIGEEDVAAWVEERVGREGNLRNALDDILERLEVVAAVGAGLGADERRAFEDALRTDLERLGNLARFQATVCGSGAIAQGDRSVAAGAGGVAAGRDIRESVVTTGDVFEVISRLRPGTRSKDQIDKQLREERESWGTR